MKTLWLRRIIAGVFVFLGLTLSGGAATKTWTGFSLNGDGNWSVGANWSPVGVPVAGDALVFPAGALKLSNTNNLAADTAFGNITLSDAYAIYGNRITITGLVTANHLAGTCGLMLALRAGANTTISCVGNLAAVLELGGRINLNGRSLTIATASPLLFGLHVNDEVNLNGGQLFLNAALNCGIQVSGAISGVGSVTKLGPGLAVFGESDDGGLVYHTPNTYNGTTFVQEGELLLKRRDCFPIITGGSSCSPVTAIPRDLVIGTALTRAEVTVAISDQISASSSVSIVTPNGESKRSSLNVWLANQAIGSVTLTRGEVWVYRQNLVTFGTLTLGGNVRVNAAAGTDGVSALRGDGVISMGSGAGRIFDVAAGATLEAYGIAGALSTSLIKSNAGAITFIPTDPVFAAPFVLDNEYLGPTDILAGTVNIRAVSGFGYPSQGTVVRAAVLSLERMTNSSGQWPEGPKEPLELRGPAPVLRCLIATNAEWHGPITLTDPNARFELSSVSDLKLRGPLSGSGGFTVIGGRLALAPEAPNAFTGTARVDQATLILASRSNHVAISGPLVIGNNVGAAGSARVTFGAGVIDTNQIADNVLVTVDTNGLFLLGDHRETIGGLAGAGEVDLGTNGTLTVAGDNQTNIFNGRLTGQGVLRKSGNSRLLINGTSTVTGVFQIVQGVLVHNGASSNVNAFVARNATLTGNGLLSSLLTERGGIISPSVSGTNPFTVRVNTRLDEVVFDIQLFGGNRRSHQLRAQGGVLLGDSALVVTAPLGTVPTNGQRYVILDKTSAGPVNGTFAGLPEGAFFFAVGGVFQITYVGGDGNDVVITRRAGSLLTGLELVGEDYMHIRGQGTNGATYILEATPHLLPPIPWVPIATNIADALGQYELIDLELFYNTNDRPRHPARFYRVKGP